MREINSRADLEALRGTPDFEAALLGIYGAMTVWGLVDGAWVGNEDLTAIERLEFTKAQFMAEIAPFDFPVPVAPSLPASATLTLDEQKSLRLAELEDKRWQVETGGMTFAGASVPTHRDARAVVTAAYIRATEDPTYTVPNYKVGPAAFITLDATTIIAYAQALEDHVQAAFDREAALAATIVAAADEAALAATDIGTGWPG